MGDRAVNHPQFDPGRGRFGDYYGELDVYCPADGGFLPWPTIFVAVLSMTVLKILGDTNLKGDQYCPDRHVGRGNGGRRNGFYPAWTLDCGSMVRAAGSCRPLVGSPGDCVGRDDPWGVVDLAFAAQIY